MDNIEQYGEISCFQALNTNMGAHIKVNLYLLDGTLIDCGPQSMEADIVPFLRKYRPDSVVLTHLHEDHCGMASWIEKNMGIPIYVSPEDIDEAAKDADYAEYRHLTWGDREAFHALPLGDAFNTGRHTLKVIRTPGHMPHHNVLFEEENGWLFSGDLYVRSRPRFAAPEENMGEMIASLEKVLSLPFSVVFCAHAGILADGREKLEKKLNYLRELKETVTKMRNDGMSDEAIDKAVFPEEQLITEVSGGEWTSLNMIKTL